MYRPEGWEKRDRYGVTVNNVDLDEIFEAGADAMGVQTACQVLNILFYKVPKINEGMSGEWWEAELRDKNIPIRWDRDLGQFIPEEE